MALTQFALLALFASHLLVAAIQLLASLLVALAPMKNLAFALAALENLVFVYSNLKDLKLDTISVAPKYLAASSADNLLAV